MPEHTPRAIVIAGASGLIGTHLTAALARRNDRVIALVRDAESARVRLPGAFKILKWSIEGSDGEWAQAIDGADAVVNLTGAPISGKPFAGRWNAVRKAGMRDSRVDGTRSIVQAMARAGSKPRVLVNASAVGYYGSSETEEFTEESGPGKDFLARLCVEWEREASAAVPLGVRTVLLRTGIVFAADGGALPELMLPFKLYVGGPMGTGRQGFPWIHIDDEIGIILHALDNEQVRGPVNLAGPEPLTNAEFSAILGKMMRRPSAVKIPAFALWLMFGEGMVLLTEGQRVLADRVRRYGYRFKFHTAESALRDLFLGEM